VSFLVLAAVAAFASGAAGAFFGRRTRRQVAEAAAKAAKAALAPAAPKVPASVGLSVGDVVAAIEAGPGTSAVDAGERERWLAGALVLREGSEVVAVVFFAPEGARQDSVVAFAAPRREIGWMQSVDADMGRDPPTTIDLGGAILERRQRVPVAVERLGTGAPRIGERATYAEYASGRDFGVVVAGVEGTVALRGVRLDPGEWEKMGSGDAK